MLKTMITREALLKAGFKEVKDDPFVALEKVLAEETEDFKAMALTVSNYMGTGQYAFCLTLPETGFLWLSPSSMEELAIIEKSIASYEPVW